jgi:hypothetical protein
MPVPSPLSPSANEAKKLQNTHKSIAGNYAVLAHHHDRRRKNRIEVSRGAKQQESKKRCAKAHLFAGKMAFRAPKSDHKCMKVNKIYLKL